ncbi:MAG: glycosyltransferase family 4 protein [bacterium]|nr:glycosyltransferase family 4 protein [bacterium]
MHFMHLLIVTQKVDKNDPILGFFHRWIIEFTKHCERIDVICLWEGEHDFQSDRWCGPVKNVHIHSLGKERGLSKMVQLFRFWRFCRELSFAADGIFVHMNAVYVLLGWPWWKKKKVFLWRNHPQGSIVARIAYALADRIFYTSPQAHAAQYPRALKMPAGIDTEFFKRDMAIERKPNSILCLGRISSIKRIEVVIEAAKKLEADGAAFILHIIGSPLTDKDAVYEKKLRQQAQELVERGKIVFLPAVTQAEAVRLYNEHEIFINATPTGSFDKTVLEAMACESIVIAANTSFEDLIRPEQRFPQDDAKALADRLKQACGLSSDQKASMAREVGQAVSMRHGLAGLVGAIKKAYER